MNRIITALLLTALALGVAGCRGLDTAAPADPNAGTTDPNAVDSSVAGLKSKINHVVIMIQENRSFDTHFGKLQDYRTANGIPGTVDGIPATASNPSFDGTTTVAAYHWKTTCIELVSPAWNETKVQQNRQYLSKPAEQVSPPHPMDGFVYTAAKYARDLGFLDTEGIRSMGYFDQTDLPYYYFMASNFATSDRWFAPVPTRTQPNRMYAFAATSQGYTSPPTSPLSAKTIFHLLEEKGVSWKIYVTDPGGTYLTYFQPFGNQKMDHVFPLSQYAADLAAGTLPSVAFIESGYNSGLDEHPDNHVDKGAAHVAAQINALMASQYWKDSVFLLTYDEGGGLYDHVQPVAMPNPDGIKPTDLASTDIQGDFTTTGLRVPLIVVSPWVKKNYVSHTPADYTAMLKLVEERWDLPNLTERDKAQPSMTEYFNFANAAWMTPPTPPTQPVDPNKCNNQNLR
jgi:phospholipase C